MKLIPLEEREGKICYFCGDDKSVKYTVTNCDEDKVKFNICCCNKCVLENADKNGFK